MKRLLIIASVIGVGIFAGIVTYGDALERSAHNGFALAVGIGVGLSAATLVACAIDAYHAQN